MKKLAGLIDVEECDVESERFPKPDEIKNVFKNKTTTTLIKKINNRKPFIGVSVLFLCITIILIGIMIYFYLKSRNNVLPY